MKILSILSKRIIPVVAAALLGGAALQAAPAPTPNPNPNLHNPGTALLQMATPQSVTTTFLEATYATCRANSPFANIDAPEARRESASSETASRMLEYAKRFLGTRYVWGATGPSAFDCSGFTSYVFRHGAGVELQRTSRQQFTQGSRVNVSDLKPGDLLFFSSARSGRGQVGHVAIVANVDPENNTCTFIHASTRRGVVYQNFPDNGYYSRHFVGAKRIL